MRRRILTLSALTLLIPAAVAAQDSAGNGAAVFQERCVTCHDGQPESRAPDPANFEGRAPEAIIEILVNGAMRPQGAKLTGEERHALAVYLTGKEFGGDATGAAHGRCMAEPAFAPMAGGASWNGWSPTVTNSRFQTEQAAGMDAADVPHLRLAWAFGFPDANSAWAQPTIVGDRVFVGSQNGTVYSLDLRTGCIHWYYSAHGGVRTAMTVGPLPNGGWAVYFGDTSANLVALDAATGEELWTRRVEDHPLARVTGSPTLYDGRLYVGTSSYEESVGAAPDYGCCTFRGSVSAVDAVTGEVVWKTYVAPDEPRPRGTNDAGTTLYGPAGAPIWSSPTIDAERGRVYVATGNTYSDPPLSTSDAVVALDLDDGSIAWVEQLTPGDVYISNCRGSSNCADPNGPDYDFGNAPILAERPDGKDVIVVGQKSGVGWELDPDYEGEVIWQYRVGRGGALGGVEWGSATDGREAYFPLSDILTPNPGGLHAVDLMTGAPRWIAEPVPPVCEPGRGCSAAQSAAITVIPGIVFSGSVDGALRAYDASDGTIVWTYDTNRDFDTVNEVPAHGGSMIGPGPAVAEGMVVVDAGYGAFGGHAGNVLLAFTAR